ncbi:GNAT family N-acetyltransferase [Gilvimarinus sp. F26214L]
MLCQDDVESLLVFEESNRLWFEEHIGARPRGFYSRCSVARHVDELLRAADANAAFPGIIEENGKILGRVNLTKIDDLTKARLGYRVAKNSAGRGVATFGVMHALKRAQALNVRSVVAFVSLENRPSQQVLLKNGFEPTTEHANHAMVAGRLVTCVEYERTLV